MAIFWFANRYFLKRSGQELSKKFFPTLAMIASIGVALGVMSLVVVLSVMSGFNREVSARLQGFGSHVVLQSNSNENLPNLDDVYDSLDGEHALIREVVKGEVVARSFVSTRTLTAGVELRGVDELPVAEGIEYYFSADSDSNSNGATVGHDVLSTLAIHPDFGDKIELIAPMAEVGPTGDLMPRKIMLNVEGVFKSGIYRYDNALIFVPKETAKKVLGLQARPSYSIELDNPNNASSVADKVRRKFPELQVYTWQEMNKRLFAALRLERIGMMIMFILTVIIASFSISGAVSMFVSNRRKDAALLQVFGFRNKDVRRIFVLQGVVIGFIGSIVGALIGVVICFYLSIYPINLPDVYYLDHIPVDMNSFTVLFFVLLGLAMAIFSAWLPVKSTLSEKPVAVLRYE